MNEMKVRHAFIRRFPWCRRDVLRKPICCVSFRISEGALTCSSFRTVGLGGGLVPVPLGNRKARKMCA